MKKLCNLLILSLLFLPLFANKIDSIMHDGIANGHYPGGVVCIVADTGIVFLEAYGNMRVYPDTVPMRTDAIFDLASLSKPTATATAIHQLAAEGRIDLNAPVDTYLFGFSHHIRHITHVLLPEKKRPTEEPVVFNKPITVMHLLTHTSGLPSYANPDKLRAAYGCLSPELLRDYIYHCPRRFEAGTDYTYSCLNFIALQYIVEAVTNQPFNRYVEQHIFAPMGMTESFYRPDTVRYADRIAPTEILKDGHVLFGEVHDPLARLGNLNISGNAGVFSTARDLAKLAQFLISQQDNPLVQVLTAVPDSLPFARTAGWGAKDEDITYMGQFSSARTYGHTGYTGTSMVIDPERKLAVIILTNHVHPADKGRLTPTRSAIADIVFQEELP